MELQDRQISWTTAKREVLGTGAVSSFVNEVVNSPGAGTLNRQFLTHPGAVAVVAWDEEADAILVLNQYRHPVRHELIEIPAGLLDTDGETPWEAAKRELAEEAQTRASTWNVLVDIFTSPGANEEALRVYLARSLSFSPRPSDFELEGEEALMTVAWAPRKELAAAIFAGKLQSPSLVTGVLALQVAILSDSLDDLRAPDASWPARD